MGIYNPKPEEDQSRTVYAYTILGKQQSFDQDNNPLVSEESKDALAKKIEYADRARYFIKVGAHGKIYNPIGIFSEGRGNNFSKRTGKPEWDFTEVNQKIFDMYLSFLRTKNVAHLNIAERELR